MRYDLAHDVLDAFKPIIKLSGNTPFRETYFQLLRTAMYRPYVNVRSHPSRNDEIEASRLFLDVWIVVAWL